MHNLEEATQIYWKYSRIWYRGEDMNMNFAEFCEELNDIRFNLIKPSHKLYTLIDGFMTHVAINNQDPEEAEM